jgi:hypothetical protein
MLKNNGFHNRHSPFSRPFSPASFFANGEQGWWYDPSNFATLFQDSAGTTPVTAVEQPVGLQLDLSGRGNHRFQATSANRPVVSARVNLLTKTEQFDDAAWSRIGTAPTVTANAAVAPDGTTTADRLAFSASGISNRLAQALSVATGAISIKLSVYLRGEVGAETMLVSDGWTISSDFTLTTAWQQFTFTTTGNVSSTGFLLYAKSGTPTVYAWGADLRVTNQGVDLPAYQRVNTSTDYDTTGFPVYIKPNGSNQFMQTNSIDFTATDKMTLWQGVRKLRDSAQSVVAELSASISANNGAFLLAAPNSAAANYNFASKGTTQVDNIVTTYTSPITNVLVAAGDISGPVNSVKVNGGAATTVTSSQGTGNYGNYAAYFYSRAGTSLYFNGNDYGSIARGAASTASQITDGETWINQRTKAY